MKDLGGLMRQAQQMQTKMMEAHKRIEALEAEGAAGAGLVKVTLSGKGELKAIAIDKTLMAEDEVEIVEDLIKAAHEDARRKLDTLRQQEEKGLMGGLGLPPGFKLPF